MRKSPDSAAASVKGRTTRLMRWTSPFSVTSTPSRTTSAPFFSALWIEVRRSRRRPLRAMFTMSMLGTPAAGSRYFPVRGEK